MPRHLISDAHEWINEILFCPYLLSSETTAKGTGLEKLAGKEDPVELDSSLAFTHRDCESTAYRSFWLEEFSARGVRKVTTGITGLWRPSVHSDVAF
ncbi:hypothetical protein ANTQUA_LOCUS10664 [Anthophora quadrimaculata]